MQAAKISDTEWRVTDDAGAAHRVFLSPGGTEADAQAALEEAQTPRGPTPEEVAAERARAVKAECGRRILAVADRNAQMNLTGAAVAGALSTDDRATYGAAVQWIAAMRAACAGIIADPALDIADDANWPPVPDGVAELAARF